MKRQIIILSVACLTWLVCPLHSDGGELELELIHESNLGNYAKVKKILDAGAVVDAPGKAGWTALDYAAYRGHAAVVKLLLERGACVSCNQGVIFRAARGGNAEVMKMFLDNGAKVDARNRFGDTPLIAAAGLGYTDLVVVLLDRGADIGAGNNQGTTALMVAAQEDQIATVERLLERRADANARDNAGYTALMHLNDEYDGSTAVMKLLLDHGADVNAAAPGNGMTSLISAAFRGRADAVKILLEHGADADAQTRSGRTALKAAVRGGHFDVASMLLVHKIRRLLGIKDSTRALGGDRSLDVGALHAAPWA